MNAAAMRAASVPVFIRYLGQLAHIAELAENHARRYGMAPAALLEARIAADMLPFAAQVDIAAQFSLRACAPLAGLEVPPFGTYSTSFEELQDRIARCSAFITALTPSQMDGSARRRITETAGLAELSLEGRDFLLQYALPNFFFHMSTAYANLRHAGVKLGKSDFDGLHAYSADPAEGEGDAPAAPSSD